MRKLIKKDNISKAELGNYFQNRNGLLLPHTLKRELDEHCQGCGKSYAGKQQVKYFGQYFCQSCVQEWTGK